MADASAAPLHLEPHDASAISAEFYDVLQAERNAARVRRLYGGHVRHARLGVLDAGAGTGRVTLMSLAESWAPCTPSSPRVPCAPR
ncbi:hypothetical protein OG930_39600 [Streptomyces sp. NBC_01799]|uniref:hypothetical protein n=1 Tax=Streptomyces sp. NBC_01800 TaxID=2975945 RepID=UPI002DDA8FBC|nr:hypothetical protein [Streptomyces sp. NBC_01800]WSA72627.1 hypothetical protein OIE65_40185 [Streptomyces sp. NBC_01800]WSA81156.1 hypothetical protein OG930_39600 [Streptomyces sp. NBC_01799]